MKSVCCSQIAVAEESNFTSDVLFEERLAGLVRDLAMNIDRGLAGHGRDLAFPLASLLETVDRAVQDDQIGRRRRIVIAVAVDVLKLSALLHLGDEVLIERDLKLRRQGYLLGVDQEDLN